MKDYQITLHQAGTEEVTIMALMAKTVKEAINHAHRCMGQGWFTVTIVEAAWHMEHEILEEIVYGRISDLVDQMSYHQNANDFIMVAVLHEEIKQLTSHMKDEDYDFFYSTDHKYLNEQWTTNNSQTKKTWSISV